MAEIVYNESHMNEIADTYRECVKISETIVICLQSAKKVVSNNYEGQGKEIAMDAFDKLAEHMEYFRVCCENTAEYVSSALQNMQEKDRLMFTGQSSSTTGAANRGRGSGRKATVTVQGNSTTGAGNRRRGSGRRI
jgi:uncharacterized protein YukE